MNDSIQDFYYNYIKEERKKEEFALCKLRKSSVCAITFDVTIFIIKIEWEKRKQYLEQLVLFISNDDLSKLRRKKQI